ncbi:MAG: ribosome maturation factor RimP [Candidatus Krumholzibacteriia bacterium]
MVEGSRPDTREIAQKVIELLEAELAADGYDLLDVRVFQGGGRYQVRVFVDRLSAEELDAGGISMQQVAKASRTAGMLLEEADLFINPYVIEVSSPGVRRPLRTAEHFAPVVGEKVDVRVKGFPRVRGILAVLENNEIVVVPKATTEDAEPDPVRIEIPWIVEANLDPEFDVQAIINADRREKKDEKRRLRDEKASGKKKGRPKNRD